MSLNNYRDEAENFLNEIGAKNGSITTKVNIYQYMKIKVRVQRWSV